MGLRGWRRLVILFACLLVSSSLLCARGDVGSKGDDPYYGDEEDRGVGGRRPADAQVAVAAEDAGVRVQDTGQQFHIFYHVFAPAGSDVRIKFVLEEQLEALQSSGSLDDAEAVHVTVVGESWERLISSIHGHSGGNSGELESIKDLDLSPFREKLRVNPLSTREGWEHITLNSIRQHCESRPDDLVMYMHSKGLYHTLRANELLRNHLMRGITAPCCRDALRANEGNVCGMRFCPDPHFHFPGNMWVARCDYIKDLLHVDTFHEIMNEVYLKQKDVGRASGKASYGAGRFADEHWIASHPALRALDSQPASRGHFKCAGKSRAALIQLPDTYLWEHECKAAPRTGTGDLYFITPRFLGLTPNYRMEEYSYLYGHQMDANGHFVDFDCTEGDAITCQRSSCAYYTRGSLLVDAYGDSIMPNSASWNREWTSTGGILNCCKSCLDIESKNLQPLESARKPKLEPREKVNAGLAKGLAARAEISEKIQGRQEKSKQPRRTSPL